MTAQLAERQRSPVVDFTEHIKKTLGMAILGKGAVENVAIGLSAPGPLIQAENFLLFYLAR